MKRRIALGLAFTGIGATVLWAQVPAGGEFRVNSYTTYGQVDSAVASDAAGGFVVVWTSGGVFAQRYDASGATRGSEFQVNTPTTSPQVWPSVASDAAGNFVVAWMSFGFEQVPPNAIVCQRFDAAGARRGLEFQVNANTTANGWQPRVAADAVGNFVVVWGGQDAPYSSEGVFAQRYDASGAPLGPQLRVNTHTPSDQRRAAVASDAAGGFVVVWASTDQDGNGAGVFGQRYDLSGLPRGGEFQVNTYTSGNQDYPAVASDAFGNFIVVWESDGQDGSDVGIFGRRYDALGAPRGPEFQVNVYVTGYQWGASVAADATGDFVVAWTSYAQDGSGYGVFARRFDSAGAPRGSAFQANTYTTDDQLAPWVASDAAGNFVVAWASRSMYGQGQDGDGSGIYSQRYGGIVPAALAVDAGASPGSDGNGVLEAGETVAVAPSWRNVNGATQTFDGTGLSFGGPDAAGVSYQLVDAVGAYGTFANGDTAPCSDCYRVGVTFGGTRPATHWDATFTEILTPDVLGQTKPWSLHVGESFADVPKTSGYYRFVETLLHKGVTAGCSASSYCPTNAVTREQMSVFVLAGKEGPGYLPTACGTPPFGDVPASSPYCRYIGELVRRGVTAGCGGGNYCPSYAVTREQMSVFLLHTLDPALNPPDCTAPLFDDVPLSSPFCRWIAELGRRGITGGCGGGNYCPADPVTREQMAVFVGATFGLTLYGP